MRENPDTRFRFAEDREDFDRMRDEAIKEKGLVMPGLADKQVKVVQVEPHDFAGSRPLSIAEDWAKKNLVGEHTLTDSDGTKVKYYISNRAISKLLSESAVRKSDDLEAHLATLKKLPEAISESIEAEVHPDYLRGEDGKRQVESGLEKNT